MITPPRLARWLLAHATDRYNRDWLLADLEEEFAERVRNLDATRARNWYWGQALRSCVPLLWARVARSLRGKEPGGDSLGHTLWSDLRYALRMHRRAWVGSCAVIATMALGIGASTAVYSIVRAVLLKPLPYAEADRSVQLGLTLRNGSPISTMAWPDVQDYRRDARSFSHLAAASLDHLTLRGTGQPQQQLVGYVSEDYFEVFDLKPVIGRAFTPEEYERGHDQSVVLSHHRWVQDFGADSSIAGRSIVLGTSTYTVVGVLPPVSYSWPAQNLDLILPLAPRIGTYQMNRGAAWLQVAGTLRPGVTLDEARREMNSLADGLARQFPDANAGIGVRVNSLRDAEVGDVRGMLILLAAAVGAVLLIACVNIANVLLGQAYGRGREFAVRTALGGGSGRLRRQLLTESLLLASLGGGIGIGLAPLLVKTLIALYPGELPRAGEIGVDGSVLWMALGLTLLAGVLTGVPVARRAARPDFGRDLRGGARSGNDAGQRRVGNVLIAAQVGLSLALIFSAGLLLRTFLNLTQTNPGFVTDNVLSLRVEPQRNDYSATELNTYYSELEHSLRALPGVTDAAFANAAPFDGRGDLDVFIPKEQGDQGQHNPQVRIGTVDQHYWSLLKVPLVAGRWFSPDDGADGPRVAVVNQALVRRFYGNANPVGRTIQYWTKDWEIVGVVGDMRSESVAAEPEPVLYFDPRQRPIRNRTVLLKSSASATILPQVRSAIRALDPGATLTDEALLQQRLDRVTAPQRFRAALIAGLGALALVLSALGVYGVVSSMVSRRVKEMGIRLALGENAVQLQWRVVAGALSVAGIGALLGVVLSLGLSRWLGAFLLGVSPTDPLTLVSAAGLLLMVATLAAWVPARRASRVDPLTALRSD